MVPNKQLKRRYRKVALPEFPRKSLSGRIDSQFLEQRRLDLQHYLKSVLLINVLRNSREINAFLAITANKQQAEAMKRLSNVDLKQIPLLPSPGTQPSLRRTLSDVDCSDSDGSCSEDDEGSSSSSSSSSSAFFHSPSASFDEFAERDAGWDAPWGRRAHEGEDGEGEDEGGDADVEEVIVWEDPLAQNTAAGNIVVVEALLRRSAAMVNHKQESNGQTALHAAVFHGQTEVLALLLQNGASPNLQDIEGLTALHVAAQRGRTEELNLLLGAKGVDVNKQTRSGVTLLMILCGAVARPSDRRSDLGEDDAADLLRHVISLEGKIRTRDVTGCTALHFAASSGRHKLCQILLENGASLDAQNAEGESPLHLAARNGHHEILRLLVEFGADVCLASKQGKALDLVLQRRQRLNLADHVPSLFQDVV